MALSTNLSVDLVYAHVELEEYHIDQEDQIQSEDQFVYVPCLSFEPD